MSIFPDDFKVSATPLVDAALRQYAKWGMGYLYDPAALAAEEAARKEAEMKPITDALAAISELYALRHLPVAQRDELVRSHLERLATDSYDEGFNDGVKDTKDRLLGVFDH